MMTSHGVGIVIAVLMIACADQRTITLRSDDGNESLTYSCGRWRSQVGSAKTNLVVADYTLRLARAAAETRDTTAVYQLMSPYESEDWAALEAIAVDHACTNAVLAAHEPAFPEPGTVPPPFSLPELEGTDSVRLADYRGRIVVLDFWATWCLPCIDQMPELARLAREHADRLVVIGVVHKDSPRTIAKWLADNDASHVIHTVDPREATARAYHVRGIPATFVIGVDGLMLPSRKHPRVRMRVNELHDYLATN